MAGSVATEECRALVTRNCEQAEGVGSAGGGQRQREGARTGKQSRVVNTSAGMAANRPRWAGGEERRALGRRGDAAAAGRRSRLGAPRGKLFG